MVRGRFRCTSVTFYGPVQEVSARQFTFAAVYDQSTPETQRYAKATPWGELKMNVDNPAVEFEVGKQYYLDFTPVE